MGHGFSPRPDRVFLLRPMMHSLSCERSCSAGFVPSHTARLTIGYARPGFSCRDAEPSPAARLLLLCRHAKPNTSTPFCGDWGSRPHPSCGAVYTVKRSAVSESAGDVAGGVVGLDPVGFSPLRTAMDQRPARKMSIVFTNWLQSIPCVKRIGWALRMIAITGPLASPVAGLLPEVGK